MKFTFRLSHGLGMVYLLAFGSLFTLWQSHYCPERMSDIHWDYVTPNIIFIPTHLNRYQGSMHHKTSRSIGPFEKVGFRVQFSWDFKFILRLSGYKVMRTNIINNYITCLAVAFYSGLEEVRLLRFFFFFIGIEEDWKYGIFRTFFFTWLAIFNSSISPSNFFFSKFTEI